MDLSNRGNSIMGVDANEQNSRDNLVHPIPQQRCAFILPHEEGISTNNNINNASDDEDNTNNNNGTGISNSTSARPPYWAAMDGLVRPVSAPAGLHPDLPALERPSSPLSRVTNPMVRDNHFRLHVAAADHSIGRQNHHSHHHHILPFQHNQLNMHSRHHALQRHRVHVHHQHSPHVTSIKSNTPVPVQVVRRSD